MIDQIKPLFGKLANFAKHKMGFERPPKLFLKQDAENAQSCLGKTAHYNPADESVTIFVTDRHPKDILRSFSHELVHHTQNLRGDLSPEKCGNMGDKYAQENPHMRKMEAEAYLVGNMCFRDWEDQEKFTLQESKILKENKTMATKITKKYLKEVIENILSERPVDPTIDSSSGGLRMGPGHSSTAVNPAGPGGGKGARFISKDPVMAAVMKILQDADLDDESKAAAVVRAVKGTESIEENDLAEGEGEVCGTCGGPINNGSRSLDEESDAFAPSHYCVHHGGVEHNGNIELAEAVSHNYDDVFDMVTHYDMKLQDGTILKNVPFEEIQVTNASLAEGHSHAMGNRDDEESEEDEDLEEAKKPDEDGDGVPDWADKKPGKDDHSEEEEEEEKKTTKEVEESKIRTPEQEVNLYDHRFGSRNTKLFESLVKKWTK